MSDSDSDSGGEPEFWWEPTHRNWKSILAERVKAITDQHVTTRNTPQIKFTQTDYNRLYFLAKEGIDTACLAIVGVEEAMKHIAQMVDAINTLGDRGFVDRGVYKSSETYRVGDGVTYHGSFWIAQRDTDQKPRDADSGWRLAVRKGRDYKPRNT